LEIGIVKVKGKVAETRGERSKAGLLKSESGKWIGRKNGKVRRGNLEIGKLKTEKLKFEIWKSETSRK